MAITTQALELVEIPPDRANVEHVGFTSADWSGLEEIIDAPGASRSIYVKEIFLTAAAAEILDIGSGGTSAPETIYFPDVQINTSAICLTFGGKWWKLPANKALTMDADGAGVVSGYVVAVQDSA